MKQPIHLPGLNGIRAIASLGVVVSHTTLAINSFGINPTFFGRFAQGMDLAGFGVSMFFCLSGFLITYLLLQEKEKTQTVAIKKFYVRRVLRIWPLYYLYLALSCAYLLTQNGIDNSQQLPFYMLLAANIPFILEKVIGPIGHYWSLGVEEQFYIFWPWLARLSHRKLYVAAVVLTIVLLGLKIAIRLTVPDFDSSITYKLIHATRFHCMLFGALASMLYFDRNRLFLAIVQNKLVQIIAWLCVGLIIINRFHIASFIDNEIVSLITVVIIIGQITQRNNIINLEKSLFNFFGKISYGVYVIHPLLIILLARLIAPLDWPVVAKLVLIYGSVIAVTTALAYISYQYYEKPFLRIKHRFTVVESSASAIVSSPKVSA